MSDEGIPPAPTDGDGATPSRRMSWIGVDYFQALRHHKQATHEELRRIPAQINNILSVRFAPNGRQFAVSVADGCMGIYQLHDGQCLHFIPGSASGSPATALRFRQGADTGMVGDVLVAVYTNGHITEWNYTTGEKIRHLVENNNQIMAIDFTSDSLMFATAGKDKCVRLYDECTGTMIRSLEGHANRVFAVKFASVDRHVLLSGGWDDMVKVWDTRMGSHGAAQGLLFGPHICGDAIDVSGHEVLTGSWSQKDNLQLWDLRTMTNTITSEDTSSMLYTAQFSTVGPRKIGIGGSKTDQFCLYDREGEHGLNQFGPRLLRHQTEGTYSCHFSPSSMDFLAAGGGNVVKAVDLKTGSCRDIVAVGFRVVPKW